MPNLFENAKKTTLGEKIDALEKLDAKLERAKWLVKAREAKLTEAETELLDLFTKDELKGATGNNGAVVSVVKKSFPGISDHELLNEYVKDNDAFDLFQARLNTRAVKARTDAGVTIPGVTDYVKVTLKLKSK